MVEVILLDTVALLGKLGDIVKVRPGYARNFLIPKEKALPATKKHKIYFEKRKNELIEAQKQATIESAARLDRFQAFAEIIISANVGAEGRLFGAITCKDVVDALGRVDFKVKKSELKLPEKYLKQTGTYPLEFYPENRPKGEAGGSIVLKIVGNNSPQA